MTSQIKKKKKKCSAHLDGMLCAKLFPDSEELPGNQH